MPFVSEETGKGTDSELIVFPGESYGDPDNIGVLVNPRTGKATNRWGDGTVGISTDLREGAEEETEAYMPHTMERYVWKHPVKREKKSPKPKRPSTRRSKPAGMQGFR